MVPTKVDRKVRILAVHHDKMRRYYLGRKGEGIERVYTWHSTLTQPEPPTDEVTWTPAEAERWLTVGRYLTTTDPPEGCTLRIEDAP